MHNIFKYIKYLSPVSKNRFYKKYTYKIRLTGNRSKYESRIRERAYHQAGMGIQKQ